MSDPESGASLGAAVGGRRAKLRFPLYSRVANAQAPQSQPSGPCAHTYTHIAVNIIMQKSGLTISV
jgi:hypothetical protein